MLYFSLGPESGTLGRSTQPSRDLSRSLTIFVTSPYRTENHDGRGVTDVDLRRIKKKNKLVLVKKYYIAPSLARIRVW